ncbi:MAG: NRPS [Bogoriella megaspora]|nr:MAG: NRPS [Bogoriella megaspora]
MDSNNSSTTMFSLEGVSPCMFPRYGSGDLDRKEALVMDVKFEHLRKLQNLARAGDEHLESALQAAWALLLRCYTGLDDVCFAVQKVRTESLEIDRSEAKNTFSSVSAMKMRFEDTTQLSEVVYKAKESYSRDIQYLEEGQKLSYHSHTSSERPVFNTLIMIEKQQGWRTRDVGNHRSFLDKLEMSYGGDICVHVSIGEESLNVSLEWWSSDMSQERAAHVASTFDKTLSTVLLSPATRVADLDYFSELDRQAINRWNQNDIGEEQTCIHEVIQNQVSSHPDADAVCAWDGNFTFAELSAHASRLAQYLLELGATTDTIIPLCFDKSKWNIVAMLAVLKAGAAFVPFDPSHPTDRLKSLAGKVRAGLLLCSRKYTASLASVVADVVPVDMGLMNQLRTVTKEPMSGVRSHDRAYLIFTSGTTGEPKGTLISHRAFCSSAKVHGPAMLMHSKCRVLQFAAHTFDASLVEILTTLMVGGCVCIPSEDARLNDVAGAIVAMHINWAVLTPSFVAFLEPRAVPGLTTLVLAGEAMSQDQITIWSNINLVNGYGPSECAVASLVKFPVTHETGPTDIGYPVGTRCWVADQYDHNRLVPPGCIGELLIEGPTLAEGYLDDERRTCESFIKDPTWVALTGSNTLSRRMYKTGDLVRQNCSNGSFNFVGRKDTQVKVHGQRVELGEIEHHVTSEQSIQHGLVLFPNAGLCAKRIVAVVSLVPSLLEESTNKRRLLHVVDGQEKEAADSQVDAVRQSLSRRLPLYMVPSIILVVESIPFLSSGKIDRKQITKWVESIDMNLYRHVTNTSETGNPPATKASSKTESIIQSVWGRVLGLPADQVSLDRAFLNLGGDSISAMQVMRQCQKRGIRLTIQDVIRSKSIRHLSLCAGEVNSLDQYTEAVEQTFDLSPIQKMFFDLPDQGRSHFNQSAFLRATRKIGEEDLHRAVHSIVERNSMLRARFSKSGPDAAWQQRVTADTVSSYRFKSHDCDGRDSAVSVIEQTQASLDAVNGPLFAVDLFNIAEHDQLIFLVGHHLVIDLVSWRVILEDIEELLTNPESASTAVVPLPFQTWCHLQEEHCKTLEVDDVLPSHDVPASDDAYWAMAGRPNVYGDVISENFEIDASTTSKLFSEGHEALRTENIDLLLSALLHAFSQVFTDRCAPAIYNEGHGREVWDSTIDLSKTVGWFTIMYPVWVPPAAARDLVETTRRVKDLRRQIPGNGRPYFASRLLTPAGEDKFKNQWPLEITFNYLGLYQQLERDDGLFVPAEKMAGEARGAGGIADVGHHTPRFGLFEISAVIVQDRLRFSFTFNRHMSHQEEIRSWVRQSQETLCVLANTLTQMKPERTLTDFPQLELTHDRFQMMTEKLERIGVAELDAVEDIYPCSQMQQGLLLSLTKDTAYYGVHVVYEVKPTASSAPQVDSLRLETAWEQVVHRHAALRTIFVESLSQDNAMYDQVVLKHISPDVVRIQRDSNAVAVAYLSELQAASNNDGRRPPHRFTICETAEGAVFCKLEISHTIMDGASMSIIFRDLGRAYEGLLAGPKPLYGDYIAYLRSQPIDTSLEFWRSYLENMEPSIFPILNQGLSIEKELHSVHMTFEELQQLQRLCDVHSVTLSNAIHTAWALTLRYYTGSDSVCFGYLTSSRDAAVEMAEEAVGPFINMLACRVAIPEDARVNDVIDQVQRDYISSIPHRNTPLAEVQHALRVSNHSALFNTVLSYRRLPSVPDGRLPAVSFHECAPIYDPTEYNVSINAEVSDEAAILTLDYWTDCLSDGQAANVADTFLQALRNITHKWDENIRRLDPLGEESKAKLRTWNRHIPERIDECAHTVVRRQAVADPAAPAICGWDASFSYAELDLLSERISYHLVDIGVQRESLVPICFDKSAWTIVAMLAILKAGAAFVPLDPSHPKSAIERRVRNSQANHVLVGPNRSEIFQDMVSHVVTVDSTLLAKLPEERRKPYAVDPDNACYVIYTSGSTGQPKGVVIEHASLVTSVRAHGPPLGFCRSSRVLQFAAYTFDNCLEEIFTTLMYGGCVCVPSEHDRLNDLAGAINRFQVNLMDITPTVASFLNPQEVPTLKALAFGGEAVNQKVLEMWAGKVSLHGIYGPTECSINCVYNGDIATCSEATNIGYAIGSVSWVVDPSDHNSLMPIGCIGELLIEGPILARGYFNDQVKTSAAFIKNPSWATKEPDFEGSVRRMYKTGDLVRYNPNGTLTYLGRKDTQVKLNGQRIEVGEIEHHVKVNLPSEAQSAVELITISSNQKSTKALAVFFCLESDGVVPTAGSTDFILPMSQGLTDTCRALEAALVEALQSYMVPSVYIPVVQMPMTSSGKLDRRTLKTTAEALPEENLADYRLAGKTGRAPSTHIEKLLQKLWASVLSIKPDSIGVDDSFFRLGGDSVSAMRLVTASRHEGILLSVASIFQRPKLVDLATHALTTSNGILPNPIQPAPRPFALLNGIDSLAGFIAGLADQCQVDKRLIEDIYPCTPIQEGLIALSNKDPGAYVAQSVYRLPSKMDITRFKKAWDTVAAEEPLLRTRIVYTKALGFLQVVVREPIAWRNFSELQQIPDMDRKVPLFDGGPLTRFSIAGEMKNDSCFVWTIHHALFDGWSIPLIHKRVQELYTMETSLDLAPSSPYSRFIAYLGELDADESDAFWKANLSDSSSHQFPKLPYASYQVPETSLLQHTAPITKEVGTDITMPSKIRAAWALVVAAYSNSDDVVFGEMVTGRDAPVPGIVDMMGPTLATIPRRLRIDRSLSVREYLEDVQRTSSEVLPYQQAGLQHIKKLSLDAEIACGFQNLIAISQGDTDFDESFWGPRNLEGVGNNFFTYPLTLSISIKDTTVELEAHYDQSLLPTWHVNKLLRCFESVLTQFAKATSEREQLGNVDMLSTEDRETITHWNSKALKASNQCVHDIIEQRALSLSSVAPAIRSWDSDFTYRELNEQSNHLARYLSEKKVAQNQLVPICFDKSAWTVVAMLAVLKAGGAFVPLDPSHPAARLGGIIQDTAAKIVLCSPQNKRLIESIAPMTLEIDKNSMNKLPLGRTSLPSCASNSPAYVIFTSGTTGTPKGTIVSHEAFSTGAVAHGSAMGMQETSRVLQFASYTFDASVMEILTTLIQGGCVCVPNESDRLNNIARTINELQVNWALLTPSFVQTISPSSIPGLKTLVLGGEAMSQSHISAWSERVVLMNAYGPSETSVIATVNPRVSKTTQPANIGKAVGGRCWIVDPVNHNRLAPIASIGELLVEGPILAQGYLGDRQKTANAFVKSPSWAREMSQADSSTSRRFYKTGDLVRYNEDGTILYLGRKDNQIKVRGQRLELGEVESNLAIDPSVKHGVAIMPTLGPCAKQITAVLSLQALAVPGSASSELQLIRAEDAREHLPSIRERLSACLPVYMVPSKWLFLHGLPLLPSGKLDRRQIAKFVESMDEDTYQQMCNLENTPQDEGHHATQVETQLRKIFSHVLNTPVEKIGLHQSFIHLGGDSIMAMQVMAQCRADKLGVTVQDVIQSKSIAELASRVTLPKKTVESAEEVDTPFQLSPIQRLYFECMGNEPNHFNQSVLLRLTSEKQPEDIVRAIDTIAASHSMLRARFSKSQAGEWEQKIIRDAAGSYRFRTHKTTPSQVAVLVKESQTCLDVQNGPLIGVDLFRFGGNESSILSIVAHHLIIDVVSWRIILQDLEDMLSTNEMSKQGSLTFQAWCRLQAEHAHLEKARRILPNMTDVPAPDLDYWGMSNASNTHGTSIDSSFELDVKATSLLLGASNGALETDIVDICIAGMLQSFHHIFTDRPRLPAIFNEGHGRDPWDHQMDLSRTVGWFTTITPVYLPNTPALDFDIVNILRWVKDLRRREPDKGREYFAYRFLTEDGRQQFSRHWPMEIAFNYLGHHQQMDRSGGLLQPVDGLPGQEIHTTSDIGEEVARFALIEISAGVTKGRLRFSFGYNKNMKRQQQITEWLSAYQKTLEEASERLAQMDAQPTLNKFPLMPPTFDGLANLATQLPKIGATSLEELEDAYPCSAMQQGILFSQLKHPEHYNYRSVLEVRPTHVAQPVDTVRLAEAWQNVVRRHASLRTVFIHNVSQQGLMDQVVLKKWLAKVKHVDHCDDVNVVDQLQSWPTPRFNDSKPPHCLMIAKTSASRVFCVLDISHAVSDGGSIPILLRDLAEAYSGQPAFDKEGPLFSEYISHIQSHSREADMDYWKSYLADIEPCFFPSLNQANQARETRQLRTFILPLAGASKLPAFCTQHGLTASNVLQLVWAIVLRSYTNSSDICFGYLTSGRDAPVRGIQDAVGAFINILVCRLNLSDNVELGKALQQTQTDFVRSMSHQYSSLADLQHHFGTSFFNTAFTYQRRSNTTERTGAPISFEVLDAHDPGEYSVTVNIEAFDHVVEVHLNYWSDVLSETQASNMASTFSHVLNSIVDSSNLELPVAELDTFSGESRQQVMKWNEKLPETVDSCVHTLIEQQSRIQPISKHAVFAWDGHLTYKQLDRLATRLASRLTAHGVQLETYVPICFEKSLWPIVAMLGIMKAGGAFVPLDPTHPVSRWKHIVNNVDAKLALCSANYQSKLSEAVETTFVVDSKSIGQKTNTPNISSAQEPKSNNTAYVIFTSGTTGLPKGTIIEHAQFCTSATEHAKAMFMRSDSRVFQFANYTFDASVMEILSTLIAGGCVCVPNEQERMSDIPGAIERMNVTWTLLTPSVANILDPDSVPSLKVLVTGGEAMSPGHISKWRGKAALINAYGPSETSVIAATSTKVDEDGTEVNKDTGTIGGSIGGRNWVVDPRDFNRLTPVGGIGELLVEGRHVARGYLKNEQKTADAFVTEPLWRKNNLLGQLDNRSERMYRTGDLVRYNTDGTLTYISRKDTQVKFNGQRIELGEIEFHVRNNLPQNMESAIELVVPPGRSAAKALSVFFSVPMDRTEAENQPTSTLDEILLPMSDDLQTRCKALDSALTRSLPAYMVPTIFVPLTRMPWTSSGKLDRNRLKQIVQSLSRDEILPYKLAGFAKKKAPVTATEKKLASLWENILNLPSGSLGLNDNFFRLGGDSIAAMRLINAAHAGHLGLTVQSIFEKPELSEMAVACTALSSGKEESSKPFTLLDQKENFTEVIDELAAACQVDKTMIQDAYPCSSLQEGLITLSIKEPGSYVARNAFKLGPEVDIDRFKAAWQKTINDMDILRTRIVHMKSSAFLQVVLHGHTETWHTAENLQDLYRQELALPEQNGSPLARYTIVQSKGSTERIFFLAIHHALYDGWSMPMILERVRSNYGQGITSGPKVPYARFIKYLLENQPKSSDAFWKSRLEGCSPVHFPQPRLRDAESTQKTQMLVHTVTLSRDTMGTEITISTVIRAAWAMLLRAYTGSEDVIFGQTLAGRDISVPGITDVIGPTLTTVPSRIRVDHSSTVRQYLQSVQQSTADTIPHQHAGLQHIKRINSDTAAACNFQNLLVIQPAEATSQDDFWTQLDNGPGANFFTYPLILECKIANQQIEISAHHDEDLISTWQVQRLINQFDTALNRLNDASRSNNKKLSQVETLSLQDVDILRAWNLRDQQSGVTCRRACDLGGENASNKPQALHAGSAWIVDPMDHNCLAPLGSVGELLLEGEDLEKAYNRTFPDSLAVHVEDPNWIAAFADNDPRTRRMLKTGRFANYDANGVLEVRGMKDHQVQLHGRRLDSQEIEEQLKSKTQVRDVVVFQPHTGRFKDDFVAVLSLEETVQKDAPASGNKIQLVEEGSIEAARSQLSEVQEHLSNHMSQAFMPTRWVMVQAIPSASSGNSDRKLVTDWIADIDEKTCEQIANQERMEKATDSAEPSTIFGKKMREIFSRVLNVPLEEVRLDQSFLNLGGDSITAMQVMAQARKEKISLSLHEIIRSQSITDLEQSADSHALQQGEQGDQEEKLDTVFELSPIQQLYFQAVNQPKLGSRFNQSQLLRLGREVSAEDIENAVKGIIGQHSMLRARFTKDASGVWKQRIIGDVSSSYRFKTHEVSQLRDINPAVSDSQSCLDVQNGPLFAADYFKIDGSSGVVFLVAHHLVVDIVSWNNIMQDLEELLDTGALMGDKPLPFQHWASMQADNAQERNASGNTQKLLPYDISSADMNYWGMLGKPNKYDDVVHKSFSIEKSVTQLALDECHTPLKTDMVDLFLGVIVHSFSRVFKDRQAPTVFNESHGREPWDPSIDISRTVGWFTAMCPFYVPVDKAKDDVVDTVKRMKDIRRKVPENGRPYFAHRFLTMDGRKRYRDHMPMEMAFNYLGRMQAADREDSLLQKIDFDTDDSSLRMVGDVDGNAPRFALFEVSAYVAAGQINFTINYNQKVKHQDGIQQWFTECQRTLAEAVTRLAKMPSEPTLSDYPIMPVGYDKLEKLTGEIFPKYGIQHHDEVEDVYPCSPMQEGLLLAQFVDHDRYLCHTEVEIRPTSYGSGSVDARKLVSAWQKVVNRHAALRTIFIDSIYQGDAFNQIVVKQAGSGAIFIECEESEVLDRMDAVRLRETNLKNKPPLPHQLTVCLTPNGKVFLKVEINHCVIDGESAFILMRDLGLAYEDKLPEDRGPRYSDYIAYIKGQPPSADVRFWRTYLKGVQPCFFPVLVDTPPAEKALGSVSLKFDRFNELQSLCKSLKVTLSNVMLVAWALVLREYVRTDDICFGYLTSGRDAPVSSIQDAIGAYINMLVSRIKITATSPLEEMFQSAQDDYLQSLPYQHCSLAQMQHDMEYSGNMFNTAVSIQNTGAEGEAAECALDFTPMRAHDPSEYGVTLNIRTTKQDEGAVLRYWTDHLSPTQAEEVMDKLSLVLSDALAQPKQTVMERDAANKARRMGTNQENSIGQVATTVVERNVVGQSLAPVMDRDAMKQLMSECVHRDMFKELVSECVQQTISELLRNNLVAFNKAETRADNSRNIVKSNFNETSNSNRVGGARTTKDIEAGRISESSDRTNPLEALNEKLLTLWSDALDLPKNEVGGEDSFFQLGGDSLVAMKMVGSALENGIALTVAEVFLHPVFNDMLAHITKTASSQATEVGNEEDGDHACQDLILDILDEPSYEPFSLLKTRNKEAFLQQHICTQLNVFRGGIEDVLPVTDFQAIAITGSLLESKWMLNYFTFEGQGKLDVARLRRSFADVVKAYPILRTIFVAHENQFLQVVLRTLEPDFTIFETDRDLGEYTRALEEQDRSSGPLLGRSYLRVALVKQAGSDHHCIMLRMSHAQYDGVAMPMILESLQSAYNNQPLLSGTSFPIYVNHAKQNPSGETYDYWRNLLRGSSMTDIVSRGKSKYNMLTAESTTLKQTIKLQSLSEKNITAATILKAAWALVLAQSSASSDVVFGVIVNGRNAAIPGLAQAVGPCLNINPVRAKVKPGSTALDLLQTIQGQQVANMPHESLGFRDIIKHCTDWPSWTSFSSVMKHQNTEDIHNYCFDDISYHVSGRGVDGELADITIVSVPYSDDEVEISLSFTQDSGISRNFCERLLNNLCTTAENISANPGVKLPSPSQLSRMPLQAADEIESASVVNQSDSLIGLAKIQSIALSNTLTQAWQQVLPKSNGSPQSIRSEDSFFDLGGDIVDLAVLVALLEKDGFRLRLEDAMRHPVLSEQVALLSQQQLLAQASDSSSSEEDLKLFPHVDVQAISIPPTPVQEQEQSRFWRRSIVRAKSLAKLGRREKA